MQSLTTPLTVLYVGDERVAPVSLEDERLLVETVLIDELDSQPTGEGVDCLLVDMASCPSRVENAVQMLRERYPSLPLVAFVGESDAVEAVLRAGASDVVRSKFSETPPVLVRRRIENACGVRTNQNAHERYETILDTAADAICQLGPDGRVEAVNDAASELLGAERTELLGKPGTELVRIPDESQRRELLSEPVEGGADTGPCEIEIRRVDGETIPCEGRFSTWTDDDGTHAGTVAVVRDISKKQKRKKELQEQEKLLQLIGNHIRDLVWIADPNDPESRIQFVSVAFEEIWQRPREVLIGGDTEVFYQTIHPEDRERVREANRVLESEGVDYEDTYRIMRPDGDLRWVHERAFSIKEDGEVQFTLGVSRDVTEQKQREHELKRQRNLLRHVQEMANIGSWEYTIDTASVLGRDDAVDDETIFAGETRWSENMYDVLEIDESVEPGFEPIKKLAQTSEWEENLAQLKRSVTTGEPLDIEGRMETESGETKWIRFRGERQSEDETVVRLRGAFQDVTAQRQRERTLERNQNFLKQTQRLGNVGGWEFDCRSGRVRWTDEMFEILELETEYEPTLQKAFKGFHPADRAEVQSAFDRLVTDGEPYKLDARVITDSGNTRWIRTYAEPVYEDGEVIKARGTVRDMHEQKQRERALETQRNQLAKLDRINRIIRDVDMALVGAESRDEIEQELCTRLSQFGRYDYALAFRPGTNDPELTARSHNIDTPDQAHGARLSLVRETLADGRTLTREGEAHGLDHSPGIVEKDSPYETAVIPFQYNGETYGAVAVCSSHEDGFDRRELDVLDELGGTVGYAIAATESKEREETLTSLYEGTQDLLGAETPDEVASVVVETAADVLQPPGIGIFLFDRQKNLLAPASMTDPLREFYDEPIVFGPGRPDSIVWQTYVTGEKRRFTDVRESPHLSNPETGARGALLLPLGEHGVFVVATSEQRLFGEHKQRLIGLLAATTEAALDRVVGREGIKERDERLEEHVTTLNQYEQLFSLLAGVERRLRRLNTREEIERELTAKLTEPESYAFAWVGERRPDERALSPRVWANGKQTGTEEGYLDAISLAEAETEPAVRAARTGEPVVISNVTDYLHESNWAGEALSRGYQSVCAVPIRDDSVQYGVATIYGTTREAFDETAVEALQRVAASVARALHLVETEQAVLAKRTVELELELPESDGFLNAVARETDDGVSYREIQPAGEGRETVVFSLANGSDQQRETLEDSFAAVETVSDGSRGGGMFRATLTGPTVPTTLLTCGGVPVEVVATAERTTATVTLPRDGNARQFLDRVRTQYPGVKLRARREQRDTDDSRASRAFEKELTERQREVVRLAYESGFFESPRETTGVELGERLGISQPTVAHHLREGQRRLLDALFDETL